MRKQRNVLVLASLLATILATEAGAATPKIDFNNDGFGDLAIGSPYATVDGKDYAGIITVFYGNSAFPSKVWKYDQVSFPAGQESENDYFGYALAAADFNADGYTDLAIGVPRENSKIPQPNGAVVVMYGSASGLKPRLSWCPCPYQPQLFTMPSPQPHDAFGSALAAGDFDMDGDADLAIGAYKYTAGVYPHAGAVRILKGGPNKLAGNNTYLSVEAQANAYFGFSLAVGNFGKNAAADLAIGSPNRDNISTTDYTTVDAGAVIIVYGSGTGLSTFPTAGGGGTQTWTQYDTPPFSGPAYSDHFGFALAAGDFGTGAYGTAGFDDLAIGIPGKDTVGLPDSGAVTVLYGDSNGLENLGIQQWSFANLAGAVVQYDNFGAALAAGNLGYDGQADLAIGAHKHPVGLANAGAVSVVFGTASGLSGTNNRFVHMDTSSQDGAFFGFSLSVAQFGGDSYVDLAVGIPNWDVSPSINSAGGVSIRHGSPTGPSATTSNQFLIAITPETGSKFGWALSK